MCKKAQKLNLKISEFDPQHHPLLKSTSRKRRHHYYDMGEDDGKGLIASLRAYPPAVFFMLGNEFCERFSFYGMRAILMLYLITEHHFSDR